MAACTIASILAPHALYICGILCQNLDGMGILGMADRAAHIVVMPVACTVACCALLVFRERV